MIHKTAAELASLVGGKVSGDESWMIESAAGLGEAGPADVSFLGNPKYAAAAAVSKAGCLLLPAGNGDLRCAAKSRIVVEDPQYAFSQVLTLIEQARAKLAPPVLDKTASIHYMAKLGQGVGVGAFTIVGQGAEIGERSSIGPQCFIGDNVRIGKQCRIYPQVVIRENCVVGDRAIIHSGTVIGADGFGFSTDRKTGRQRKIPQLGNVVVGDDVEIGANVAIDRATTGSTQIGAGTKIDNLVQIGHNVRMGKDCLIVSHVGIAGSCVIGDRVILAGQAGIAGHLEIGDGAIVMAQAGVMSDIEKGKMVFGTPSRPHRESFKLQVLYGKLPELFEAVKAIKQRLGIKDTAEA